MARSLSGKPCFRQRHRIRVCALCEGIIRQRKGRLKPCFSGFRRPFYFVCLRHAVLSRFVFQRQLDMRFGRLGRFFQSKFDLLLFAQQIAPVAFLYQSRPSNSIGCWIRSQPLPHCKSSSLQYLSQPQQIRSGFFGKMGNFLAMVFFFCLCAVRQNYK